MRFNNFTINLTKIAGFILLGILAHRGEISWMAFFAITLLMADLKLTFNR